MLLLPTTPSRWFLNYAERLRFPQLLVITAALFVADVLIPDLIPFADELLLGLLTLLFSVWRGGGESPPTPKPPEKDITPPEST